MTITANNVIIILIKTKKIVAYNIANRLKGEKFMNYLKVASICPSLKVANIDYNIREILKQVKIAKEKGVEVAVFPELSITGYTCADLFLQSLLVEKSLEGIKLLVDCIPYDILVSVGAPLYIDNALFNCAINILNGEIVSITTKTYIPNYKEFYEKRWFQPTNALKVKEITLFNKVVPLNTIIELNRDNKNVRIGVEICEDLWVVNPPSSQMSLEGADVILNLSASNETIGKNSYRENLIKGQSARCIAGYVYSSAGVNESTTDIVFSGSCYIVENGKILDKNNIFDLSSNMIISDIDIDILRQERSTNISFADGCISKKYDITKKELKRKCDVSLDRVIDPYPFIPSNQAKLKERCLQTTEIQTMGLVKRLSHINCKNAVIGVSGGLDSTLALLVTCRAFDTLNLDRKGIIGITMPGMGTTKTTKTLADNLMDVLGITSITIDISKAATNHLEDIGHKDHNFDVTFENAQARERTQVLMDYANKVGGIVIGTGDLSELALGWATYNGDHMSMYSVNGSIPKTLVKYLVNGYKEILGEEVAKVLDEIVSIPISPELLPADKAGKISQKTEDIIGPYELHDFFLYHMIRFGEEPKKILMLADMAFENYTVEEIKKWLKVFLRRFFTNQFKRSCVPDGPKVGSVSLSPRGDWRMPSDASYELWMNELENI